MDDVPDIGISQANIRTLKFYSWVDVERLKTDWKYNMDVGNIILEDKLKWVKMRKLKPDWQAFCKKYNVQDLSDAELALLAYNGVQKNHSFLYLVKRTAINKPWEKYLSNK